MNQRFIDQTTFYNPDDHTQGNCTEACVASILGLKLEDVPRFYNGQSPLHYWKGLEDYFDKQGYTLCRVTHANWQHLRCMALLFGMSERGCGHMVIVQWGKVIHDPHPSRAGLKTIDGCFIVCPFDPLKEPGRRGIL